MSFADVDQLFGTPDIQRGYDVLKKRYDAGDKSSDLLRRLARCCHELACATLDKGKKKGLIFEGKDFAMEGYKMNEDDFEALKWAGIMVGSATDHMSTKERIEEGGNFKALLDKALEMNNQDYVLLHMRGRFSHSVASLTWVERKAATILYSAPPVATMEEALADFLGAYELKPDWIENLVWLIRTYLALNDKENAKKYINKLLVLTPANEDERDKVNEAKKLLAKC